MAIGDRISSSTLIEDYDKFKGEIKRRKRKNPEKLTAQMMLDDNEAYKRQQRVREEQAVRDYNKQAAAMDMALMMARGGNSSGSEYKDPVSITTRNMMQRAVDRATEDKGRQLADSIARRGISEELKDKMLSGAFDKKKTENVFRQVERQQDNERKYMSQFKDKDDYESVRRYGNLTYDEINERIWQNEGKTGGAAGFALVGNKEKQDAAYDTKLLRMAAERAKTSEDVKKEIDAAKKTQGYNEERLKEMKEEYEERKAAEDYAARKEYYDFMLNADDFDEYVNRGAKDSKPLYASEHRDEVIRKYESGQYNDDDWKLYQLTNLNDNEARTYTYILGKEGQDKADEYLDFINDEVQSRLADEAYRYYATKDNGEISEAKAVAMAPLMGLARASNSLYKAGNMIKGDKAEPVDSTEILGSKIRENLEESPAAKILYDLGENVGNMIPSIAVGALNPAAGTALMGIGAGGEAANEAWREGSSRGEALAYGAINGTLEATLQRYLGGISKLGGKMSGITKDVLSSKAKSTLGKALINMGVTSLSEGSEEYLQEIIDPLVQNIVLGKDNELHFISKDAMYAGFLGALTGNAFEAGVNINNARTDSIYEGIGRDTDENVTEEIVDYARNNEGLSSLLSEYEDNPNNISLGRLRAAVENDIGDKISRVSDEYEAEDVRDEIAKDGGYIADIADEAMEDVGFINRDYDENDDIIDGVTGNGINAVRNEIPDSTEILSDKAKWIMNDSMPENEDADTYGRAFADFYQYGRAGMGYDTAEHNSVYNDSLTLKQKKLAYTSGLSDRQAYFADRQRAVSSRINKGQGILRYINDSEVQQGINIPRQLKDMSRRQRSSTKALRHIAKVTGQNIALYESGAVNGEVTAPNGWYNPDTDTIYIDINSGDVGETAMMRTASHEVTHVLKEWSPEKYRVLQDHLTRQYEADGTITALVQYEIDKALSTGVQLTYEQAMDEVTANACEMMLKDSKAIQKLADESPDIFTRIKDVITGIINDIKKAFNGVKGSTYEYKRMEELLYDWEGVQKLWDDAFVSMSKNANKAKKAAAGEVVNIGRNISYCARMSFAAQVDAILGDAKNNKEYAASHVLVSETTPEVYVNEFDLPDLPVLMTAEHVYSTSVSEDKAKADKRYKSGKNYHDLGEILKKIPDAVKNPVMVIKSNMDDSDARIAIVTELTDKNNLPVIVAMQPFGKGRFENNYIRANVVVSTYGKNISNYVKTALDDERILWVDKGKSRMLNLNPRLQLSSIIQTSDFSNNLSRYRQIVNSIIRKKSKNDTGNIQFSLRDTEYGKYIDEGIVSFVEDVRAGKYNYNAKHVISESIPQRLADDIKKITGIKLDAENCSNDINKNSIEHITKRHGEHGKSDKSMADIENIGLIDYVINNYDSVELGKTSIEYRNSDGTYAKTVLISKQIDGKGNYYVVEAIPDLKNRDEIHVTSAYIGNKKGASQVSHAKSLSQTSETKAESTPDKTLSQDEDTVNSLRDNRSNREILVNALESTAKNDTEKQILEDYKQMADTLDMFESLKKEKQKAMRSAETAEERDRYAEDIKHIDDKIAYHDKKLLELESTKALKDVISREADIMSRKNVSDLKERQARQRTNKQKQVLRDRIKSNASALITMATKPMNSRHIPEDVSRATMEFLSSIDYISEKADPESWTSKQWHEKMERLMTALEAKKGNQEAFINNESIDPDLMDRMKKFVEDYGGKKLSELDMKGLEDMYIIVRSLRMGINNANKMHANKLTEDAEKLGYETITELGKKKDRLATFKTTAALRAFLNCDMLDAMSYFKMMGPQGMSIFNELAEGWNVAKRDIKKAQEFMEGLNKKYGLKRDYIKTISGKNAEIYKFDVEYGTVELTKAEIMSLYCLAKRKQARDHITGEGIRATHTKKRGQAEYSSAIHLDVKEINKITDTLTDVEKQIAEDLQRFLKDECAEWGNDISMEMYGYRKFSDPDYFPIETDPNKRKKKKADEGESGADNRELYKIINLGFTKPLADNPTDAIMVRDIFDVFTGHVSDMAQYHGMAMPVTDAMKWWNYKYSSGNKSDTIQEHIERVFGKEYNSYFTRLIKDINNEKDADIEFNFSDWLTSKVKAAAVGANVRVVIQQPTAYIRAYNVMDTKYLAKALFTAGGAKKANKYSSLAFWKSEGYFETNVGRSLKTVITGQQSVKDSIVNGSMWLAGKADDMTWGKIWNACELEIKDKNKGIDTDSEEFMRKVAARFDEVIYETQVVDTVLTRPQIMRSKNSLVKMATSFMAEPLKSYNMLRNAIVSKKGNAIGRAVVAFAASNIVNSAITAVWDSLRDLDDDEEKEKAFAERFMGNIDKNLIDNLNPFNLVPYAKDIISVFEGYDVNRMDMQVFTTAKHTMDVWIKYTSGDKTAKDAVLQTARLISQFTGIPAYNAYRDSIAAVNMVKYEILGMNTYEEQIKSAASARRSGDMDMYEMIVKDLKDEGKPLDGVIEDVNKSIAKEKRKAKEADKSDDDEQKNEEEAVSLYKTTDIVTELINGDIESAQNIINDIYDTAVENADKSEKNYKYETYKKKRAAVKAAITKHYKTIESREERREFAKLIKGLRLAKQVLYKSSDIVDIENSMKKSS